MMDDAPDDTPQTPAQWAVRWHGLVAAALLLAAVPVVHIVWHGALGHERPPVLTRSQVPPPAPTWATLLDGTWMIAKERQLREASPVVWWLRSSWNELRYRLGAPDSGQVHFGKDGWFFLRPEVLPDVAMFERAAEPRRRFLRAVRDRVRRSGAEFFLSIVPDKARVYPERAYADGVLAPAKAGIYPALLADLAAEGIPTVDLAAAMAAARAAAPDDELYYRRDTHWRPAGALVAGRAVAAAIEGGPAGARLAPRRRIELGGKESIRLIGDLTALCGIGTVELPDERGTHTVPMSFLSEQLAETRDYYGVVLRDGDRSLPMYGDDPDAEVLLVGTSFAEENGLKALSLALGRPVRGIVGRGASGLEPLQQALREIDQGTRAKVVVWEMVERGFFEEAWRSPRL